MALAPLYEEHLVLGATFGDDQRPIRYATEHDAVELPEGGAVLADVSHLRMLLMSGEVAPGFARAAFAGRLLEYGECAFEAVLTGDGSVASIPLVARTGDLEYVAMDLLSRGTVLEAWLSFLSSVEQDGYAPFADMQTEDVSGSHVALLLWGDAAGKVLADYVNGEDLPAKGSVRSLQLDAIPCIVASLQVDDRSCFLVLVPPYAARTLWRSFLSFVDVMPVGEATLLGLLSQSLQWTTRLKETDALRMDAATLEAYGLVRDSTDFVGARGLSEGGVRA